MRAFRRNLAYKLLSVAVAVILYAIAYGQQNPNDSRQLFVTPEARNLPPEMVLKSGPNGVMVTVSGPGPLVEAFRAQPVKGVVDLSRVSPGQNKVPIRWQVQPGALDIAAPLSAEVTVEKKARMDWDVDPLYDDAAAPPGFAYEDPEISPRRVTVSGLPSEVSKVDRVVAIVSDAASPGETAHETTADVVAQNIRRQVIDTVEIEPRTVRVTLRLKRASASKAIVLSPRIGGSAAPGYVLSNVVLTPPTVSVTGAASRLAQLTSIPVPLDVSGLRASETRRIRIPVPEGVALASASGTFVAVRLEVQAVGGAVPVPAATPPAATPKPAPSAAPTPSVPPATPSPLPSVPPVADARTDENTLKEPR